MLLCRKKRNLGEKMNVEDIRKKLEIISEPEYAVFNKKICNDTTKRMLGIRIPKLKALAKEISKEEDWKEFIEQADINCFEETILKGLVIAYSKLELKDKLILTKQFIPEMDSWAITDTFCPALKIKPKELEEVWKFILPYSKSDKEFEARFSIIMMLDYYLTNEYVDKVIEVIDSIENNAYYVQMAKAWVIAEIGVKYYPKAMEYLKGKNHLDKFTYNKALQKMIESYRITDETKVILRSMKRKN